MYALDLADLEKPRTSGLIFNVVFVPRCRLQSPTVTALDASTMNLACGENQVMCLAIFDILHCAAHRSTHPRREIVLLFFLDISIAHTVRLSHTAIHGLCDEI